jgi:beta-lactamase regulating signal transducer with metallopeptidase domain
MIASWMIYATLTTLFFGLAAWALDRGIQHSIFPTRWIWAGALLGSLGLAGASVMGLNGPGPYPGPALDAPGTQGVQVILETVSDYAATPAMPVDLDPWVLVGWIVLSTAVLGAVLRAFLRLRALRRQWEPRRVNDRAVLISDAFGPALVGLLRPAVVLPRWALNADPGHRELMLRHEEEHGEARDAYLLAGALLAVVALPWNLGIWWIASRLRVAVEIDCDRRVLRRSPGVREYAELLLRIGSRASSPGIQALAFSRPVPFLERRIRAMTDSSRPRLVRSLVFVVLAALGVFAACEMRGPDMTAPGDDTQGDVLEELGSPASAIQVTDLRLLRDTVGGSGIVTGAVENRETGAPLISVQVYIPTIKVGALTNSQGRFLILRVPPGDHEVVFEHADLGKTTARVLWADATPTQGLVPTRLGGAPGIGNEPGQERLPPPPTTGPDGSPVGIVTGVVVDGATGERVESAQVFFPDLNLGALTNSEGRFVLLNVPLGTHALRVEKVGMDQAELEVMVDEGTPKQLEINMGGI